jgi:signal transduction histidine kinase
MKRLVEDLLSLAKSDSAESTQITEQIDYSFLVINAVLALEPVVFDAGKKLTYDIQDRLFVSGDSRRLQQLIAILLDNALKYCPSGGKIKLKLTASDKKTALLTVTNEGKPIPKDELEKIFRRFYRADKSRSDHDSFGLGLAIAESLTKEHGGKIWAENDGERGNRFFVALPLLVSGV